MPNPLRKLPTKPARTAPSSRVKKTPKPGSKKFVGPLPESYYENMEAREYNQDEHAMRELDRGPDTRKRVMRRQQDEYDKEYPGRSGGKPFSGKVDVGQAYYQLRKNLSPKNQRLLDILAGRGGDSNDVPF